MNAEGILTADKLAELLKEPSAAQTVWEVTHGDGWDLGVHWVWSRKCGELYTAEGLALMVEKLRETGCAMDALTLDAWLPTQPPAPDPARAAERTTPPKRKPARHLPYHDEDDEAIFNAQFSAAHAPLSDDTPPRNDL